MADNVTLNSGSGGAVLRTQDVSSVHYAVGLVAWGVDGGPYTEVDDASGSGLPVQPDAGASWTVVGAAAHDAAVSGNPLLVGARAQAVLSGAPTAVSADGDAVRLWADRNGRLIVATDGGTTPLHVTQTDPTQLRVGPSGGSAVGAIVSDNPVMVGGVANSSAPTAVDAGDAQLVWVDLNGRVQIGDGGGSLTVDNGGTFAVQAAQSGTWNVGTVTTVSAVTSITNTVTVDSELPAAAALADNAANPTAPAVGAFGMVWDGSTWDRAPGNSTDGLLVNLGTNNDVTIGAALPAGGNTIGDVTISGSALTALQLIDDAVKTDDAAFTPASDKVLMVGATFDDTASDSVDEGDAGALRMSARRELYTQIRDAAGNERGANVNASNQLLTSEANSSTIATHAGTIAGAVSGTEMQVDVLTSALPTGAATLAEQQTQTTSLGVMDDWDNAASDGASVSGDVAHDTADAGEPVKLGAKATTSLAGLTLVADADRTNLFAGVDGVLIVRPHCNLEDVVQDRATNTDGASTAFAGGLAAPGAGVRLWIKSVTICNSSASFCTVDLRDGAAGSVLWTFPVPATGGVTHVFDPPLKLTANTALAYDASAATTTLTISANGFKSKV